MADGSHMTPDEFRRLGRAYVDWVADYWERVDELPVQSPAVPGSVYEALPTSPPGAPGDVGDVLEDLDDLIVPALTQWQHPSFFAFFPANTSGPGVLADLVSSGLGINAMNWATSPAATELEMRMLDWFVDLLGLPAHFRHDHGGPGGGVLQDTASSATLCTLVAARNRATPGGDLAHLRVYASDQAHSSVTKGARIAGLAPEQVRAIASDAAHAMRPDALAESIETDRRAGLTPIWVCATVGTTSSMAIDPVAEIAAICRDAGAWCHVDAAMAGSAAVCDELRWVTDGAEAVDSWSFNPHKWLFTTFDCTCLWLADARPLTDALTITPAYLRSEAGDAGTVIDFRDWQIQLGRRFRALKPWMVMRHYGAQALAAHVREHVRLARVFADRVLDDPRFELAAPPALNLVCLRVAGPDGDARTTALAEAVNASGAALVTTTELDDRPVLRVCVGQMWTTEAHVDALWTRLCDTADSLG